MKKMTCEMCGSTDLVKESGFFVCQSCGTKYSVEEAKKMMIEGTVDVQGTVKVDNSAFVEKYLVNARKAREKEDWNEVEKYYGMVEENDPTNIEAIFYGAYAKAKRSLTENDLDERKATFEILYNCLTIAGDKYNHNDDRGIELIEQISTDITNMADGPFVFFETTSFWSGKKDDRVETQILLWNLRLVFTEALDKIIDGYSKNDKKKKIQLLKLALSHVEAVLEDHLSLPSYLQARIIGFAVDYTQKIHALDPSFPVKKEEELKNELASARKKETKSSYTTLIVAILAAVLPVLGAIISGVWLLLPTKEDSSLKITKELATTTLLSNIAFTVFLVFIILTSIP